MIASIFIGTSVDGFIARPDGALDFLPAGGGEPHGYTEFFASIDALVIGRRTFEAVLAFPQWPYGEKLVFVLSSQPLEFSKVLGARVERMQGSPREIFQRLEGRGIQHVYVDGGITIQRFLGEGLIQRLIITRVPVLIGQGIPLFGSLPRDIRLDHVQTEYYASGLVKTEYRVTSCVMDRSLGSNGLRVHDEPAPQGISHILDHAGRPDQGRPGNALTIALASKW